MKQFIAGITMFLFCCLFAGAQEPSDFNPNNPPEPKSAFTLTLVNDSVQAGMVTGGGSYYVGNQALLTATPNNHYVFVAWMEGNTIISNSRSFQYTMPDRPVTLQAKFEFRQVYLLSLSVDPANSGSVNGGGYYESGQNVDLSTNTSGPIEFKGWWEGNSLINSQNSFQFQMPNRPVNLTARYEYNPSNPNEPHGQAPKHHLYLISEPLGGGSFSQTSGVEITEKDSINIYAYQSTNFVFDGWYYKGEPYSTSTSVYFKMGMTDDTLTAHYHYDPSGPGEPNPGNKAIFNLTTISQTAASGSKLAFPVYLSNENLDVYSVIFEATFPAGVLVDYNNVSLSSRSNGHILKTDSLGNNLFRFTISNSQTLALTGSSGSLVTIPVTLPTDWKAGSSYPVVLSNATIGTISGQVNCPVKNGTIGVTAVVSDLYASFYSDVHLNRVLFTNMSSTSALTSRWNFGDGESSTEKNPLHVYAKSGSYNVVLTVSNDIDKDSIQIPISITDEANWSLESYYTLSTKRNNVKNFTSGLDLFNTFSKCKITGDVFIQVESNQTFYIPMDSTVDAIFKNLGSKISKVGGPVFTFSSEKPDSSSILDFSGTLLRTYVETILETAKNFRFKNVDMAFSGLRMNVTALHELNDINICSGRTTPEINLALIGNQYDINWQLADVPPYISGQKVSGSTIIPAMTLINDTTFTNNVVYNVQLISNGYVFYTWDIRYIVLASIQTLPKTIEPASNTTLGSPNVTFKWESQNNALYDLYLWENGTTAPKTPTVSGIWSSPYADNQNCQYGRSYKWKILARSSCDSIWSPVDSFNIGRLPDLQVESITLSKSEIFAGDELDVHVKVHNIGGKAFGSYWGDYLYLVYGKNQQNRVNIASTWKWQKLDPDSSYQVDFHVVLPLDTVSYTNFLFVADYSLQLTEINELNNTILSETLNIKHYLIDNKEYNILKKLNDQTIGIHWTTRWNVSTNLLIANNWKGVGFLEGHVVSIDLNNNNLNGQLPAELFNLPYLRTLNLNNNKLNGNLKVLVDSMKFYNYRCDSLNHLDLGYNSFTGEISSFAYRLPNLSWLNLESNRFSEIDTVLSRKIVNLNLQSQTFNHPDIPLSMKPALVIPPLFWYKHETPELLRKDLYFYLMKNNNYLGWISYKDSKFFLTLYNDWVYTSTDSVDIVQYNSNYLNGSRAKLHLSFKMGDANIDQMTDILDVQHTLNRILQENAYPFNNIAANTFPDNKITVQDIVSTVNILLETGVVADSVIPTNPGSALVENFLFIADDKIMLDIKEPVSALDLSLKNVKDKQLGMLLSSNDFQSIARNTSDGVRLIIFSGSGKEIPAGLTSLAQLSSSTAKVVGASLSNKQANSVPVLISKEPTDLSTIFASVNQVSINQHNVTILVKIPVEKLTALVYNMQGLLIDQKELNQLSIGSHTIEYSNTLPTGAYLLKLIFRNGDSVQAKNYKWIVSK